MLLFLLEGRRRTGAAPAWGLGSHSHLLGLGGEEPAACTCLRRMGLDSCWEEGWGQGLAGGIHCYSPTPLLFPCLLFLFPTPRPPFPLFIHSVFFLGHRLPPACLRELELMPETQVCPFGRRAFPDRTGGWVVWELVPGGLMNRSWEDLAAC